jgi:hypothetical protein
MSIVTKPLQGISAKVKVASGFTLCTKALVSINRVVKSAINVGPSRAVTRLVNIWPERSHEHQPILQPDLVYLIRANSRQNFAFALF